MAAAALWTLVRGRAETRTALNALYGIRGFTAASEDSLLDAHARARRFADTSASTSSLWLAAQASIVFSSAAYSSALVAAKAMPRPDRAVTSVATRLLSMQVEIIQNTAGTIAAAVALLVVLFVVKPLDAPAGTGAAPYTEPVFAVSLFAAVVGTAGDAVSRCFSWSLYAVASACLWANEWQSVEAYDSNEIAGLLELNVPTAFDDPATTSAVAVVVAFAIAALITGANVVWTYCGASVNVSSTLSAIEHQIARCAESVAFLLFGFGAVRLADSDGGTGAGVLHGGRPCVHPSRDAISYAFVHFVPFIVASSTRHSNADAGAASRRRMGWRLGCFIPFAAAVWASVKGAISINPDESPAAWAAAAPIALAWLVEAAR
jgi:hypothetical protein